MTFILNTASGVLHRSPRCAGRDSRFHVPANPWSDDEERIGAYFRSPSGQLLLRLDIRDCRKCFR